MVKHNGLTVLIVGVSLLLVTVTEAVADDADMYNRRGTRLELEGKLEAAATELSKAITALGDCDEARPARVIECAIAHTNRGNVHTKLGQTANALADYNRAIELSTKEHQLYLADALIGRAGLRIAQQSFQEALKDSARAVELYDQMLAGGNGDVEDTAVEEARTKALTNRMLARKGLGDHEGATKDIDEVIRVRKRLEEQGKPGMRVLRARALSNKGILLSEGASYKQALEVYNEADLILAPLAADGVCNESTWDYASNLSLRGTTLANLRHSREAILDFKTAIPILERCSKGRWAEAPHMLAVCQEHLDRLQGTKYPE